MLTTGGCEVVGISNIRLNRLRSGPLGAVFVEFSFGTVWACEGEEAGPILSFREPGKKNHQFDGEQTEKARLRNPRTHHVAS